MTHMIVMIHMIIMTYMIVLIMIIITAIMMIVVSGQVPKVLGRRQYEGKTTNGAS